MIAFKRWGYRYKTASILCVLFLVSRFLYYQCGVTFDASFFSWGWQGLDPELLKTAAWQNIGYMHSQPPLFNAVNALLLKTFDSQAWKAFWLLMLTLGCIQVLLFYAILQNITQNKIIIPVALGVFLLNPTQILYENWYFYTYGELTLLLAFFGVLSKLQFSHAIRLGSLLLWILTILTLWRSFFHWSLPLCALFMLIYVYKPKSVKGILYLIVPVLISLSWPLKNYVLWGEFTNSSWSGMNLARVAVAANPELFAHAPFEPVTAYSVPPKPVNSYPYPASLTDTFQSNGVRNLHHKEYVALSKAYGDTAGTFLLKHPQRYVDVILKANTIYFQPAAGYNFLTENAQKLPAWMHIWTGKPDTWAGYHTGMPAHFPWQNFVLYITAVAGCLLGIMHPQTRIISIGIGLSLLYIWAIGTGFEIGENQRFRFITTPGIILGLMLFFRVKDWRGTCSAPERKRSPAKPDPGPR